MNKNHNKGCLSGILGTALVILGVVIYAVLSSLINRLFIGTRLGGEVACALLSLTLTGLGVAFVLYEIIFIVWQVKLSKKAADQGREDGKMNRIFRMVFAGCVCLSLLFSIFSANTYTLCREDSISKVCFVTLKEYRWDEKCDVLRYSFACDAEGGLTYSVTMKDGETVALLGSVTSLSDGFKEKFDTDRVNMLSYAAYLSESFDQSDFIIEKKVSGIEHMEKYFKENSAVWEQIQRIISSEAALNSNE